MARLTTNWDALLASAPINAQASRDATAQGEEYPPLGRDWMLIIGDWNNLIKRLKKARRRKIDSVVMAQFSGDGKTLSVWENLSEDDLQAAIALLEMAETIATRANDE